MRPQYPRDTLQHLAAGRPQLPQPDVRCFHGVLPGLPSVGSCAYDTRTPSGITGACIVTSRAADPDVPARLTLEPIGYVRCSAASKVQVARQPRAAAGVPARIELLPGRNFEHALEDLARWKLIWVLFWFHQNPGWRPKVLPPRSTTGRKGVFATRSPHRPNPIGMSVVRLERVDGLTVHIRDADMLDGTPVLDLKPYVAYTDAHPEAGDGWLADEPPPGGVAQPDDPVAGYAVRFEPQAFKQAEWIEAH